MFPPGFTCPAVLWILTVNFRFRLRDSHPLWLAFPRHSANFRRSWCKSEPQRSRKTSGLASSAFARHYLRNLGWCLFLPLLRCFSSGRSPRTTILFTARYLSIAQVCSHIRISPDQRLFAAPRSFSQLVTSFIGSWCQGIPLALLLAWPNIMITILVLLNYAGSTEVVYKIVFTLN